MTLVSSLRLIGIVALIIGLATPFVVDAVDNQNLANAFAVFGWLCFVLISILFPAIALISGKITTRTSITFRANEPFRFWVGLITLEILVLFFAFMATLWLHGYLTNY